ncbi:DUF4468 domain-containing protein [Hymenobacter glacieicola]|uniref:DUF4468 domain-containing protein n=1 Tax=Hymenobacter glacieicola TaxID=1562124 RepID=A0ABQ1WVB8_9BACT|nr:DUF4468 domain-containing protein [Hymenobacter glacieicola]GGG44969.1 hypothetical protein GCM10011378_21560 [Hymenobacter glacieicola]
MKQYFLVLTFSCIFQVTQAQRVRPLPIVPVDSASQRICYRGTLAAPTLPATELFGRTQEWLARQFEDYGAVVKFSDPGRGLLVGQAIVRAHAPAQKNQYAREFNLLFRFYFRVQAGTLRYELTDISYPRYTTTYAAADAGNGLAADGLVGWLRQDEFARISTGEAQTYRQPVEPELRDYDQYTEKGAPRPRMLQQCQGIQEAMTTLLASLSQELVSPRL